jgi:uncharacterized protein
VELEPFRLAREDALLELRVPLDAFPRLAAAVVGAEGPVEVRVAFARDENGRCRARGSLAVTLDLNCANCREVGQRRLEVPVDLCIVTSDDAARALASELDPLVLDGSTATPAALFEDDLLLALPERPCEDLGRCARARAFDAFLAPEPASEPEREHPFAALAVLKDRRANGEGE